MAVWPLHAMRSRGLRLKQHLSNWIANCFDKTLAPKRAASKHGALRTAVGAHR
eukprot:CAMPEP_0183547950 /NCGR_PEP_ID=MMETSP0371-20130417/57715_1 /TAXON_ID=268820 /ORGANISM="Peridinium aciculiferum, Strain PAER-2" /LENGTH=52 /DNA_ID=CAMNT_0025751097 /DNA_START=187 /DNA_END=341 /DNA_ORIENTATION=-